MFHILLFGLIALVVNCL